ncbi:hypothetical protein SAMN05216502_101141 [Citrobacter amalonaticus]|nr:hypothetical protein L370_02236 [Enterobacter sp. MGH 24]SFA69504.1 hypothetical protein SAMN05216502_101141 [Citrobacter amalonaticus]
MDVSATRSIQKREEKVVDRLHSHDVKIWPLLRHSRLLFIKVKSYICDP